MKFSTVLKVKTCGHSEKHSISFKIQFAFKNRNKSLHINFLFDDIKFKNNYNCSKKFLCPALRHANPKLYP